MRDREFGVELEFSSNGHSRYGVGDALYEAGLGDWTGERYQRNYYNAYGDYMQRFDYRGIGNDGSEVEIRSPILKGKKGFQELKDVVEILNDLGCYTTNNDGLHVHHNAPEFEGNKDLTLRLLKSWFSNQDEISKMIEPRRVIHNSPCPSIRAEHLISFENHLSRYDNNITGVNEAIYGTLPRGNINLQALPEHGSIELRYLEGTLDWDTIDAWIRFGQSFLNSVTKRKRSIKKADNPVILMNRLKTSNKAKTILTAKVAQHHTIY